MNFSSIDLSRKLALLVMLAIIPSLVILLYSSVEQRRISIESAQKQLFQLIDTIVHTLEDTTQTAENLLSTLSVFPAVRTMDVVASNKIFKTVLKKNPNFSNISLIDLSGDVLASGKDFVGVNLADRKHFKEVLEKKDFVVGEYIESRIGPTAPVFAFAYPVLDRSGNLNAVLTAVIKLPNISHFHDTLSLPERSFISITDHQGIRLFYYPAQKSTNPIGKPIKATAWKVARTAQDSGSFINTGSDGYKRIFSFEQIRLTPEDSPYLYVWAGIPEDHILGPANVTLTRNLVLMLMVTMISFFISRVIGKNTEALIVKLEKAIQEIKTLRGIIPICSFCKNIRNDEGYYEQLEEYIHKHSGADFSHTICPTCLKKHYPDIAEEVLLDTEEK